MTSLHDYFIKKLYQIKFHNVTVRMSYFNENESSLINCIKLDVNCNKINIFKYIQIWIQSDLFNTFKINLKIPTFEVSIVRIIHHS